MFLVQQYLDTLQLNSECYGFSEQLTLTHHGLVACFNCHTAPHSHGTGLGYIDYAFLSVWMFVLCWTYKRPILPVM